MKICFICNEYPPGPHGGIGTSTQVLARALVERGHIVRVVGVYKSDYPSPDFENDQGVQVWRLRQNSLPKLGWLLDRWRLFHLVKKWSRADEIDLVDVPDYQGWAAGWRGLAVPVNVRLCLSSSTIHKPKIHTIPPLNYVLEKMLLLRANHFCAKSRYLAEETSRIFSIPILAKAIVVYNPVSIPALPLGLSRSNHIVVFAGTLNEQKGVRSLVSAWTMVQQKFSTAELHLYGKDGRSRQGTSLRQEMEEYLSIQRINNVFFHGHVDRKEILEAFANARLAVFPSYQEGFSNVVLEAMACGCPTIYTQRASGPEVITHEQDGLLINPDSPEEIATQILRLLNDDVLAKQLGANGQDKVRRLFSLDRITDLNEKHFQTCVK